MAPLSGILQLAGLLLDQVTTLVDALEAPEVQASPGPILASVGGYFDALLVREKTLCEIAVADAAAVADAVADAAPEDAAEIAASIVAGFAAEGEPEPRQSDASSGPREGSSRFVPPSKAGSRSSFSVAALAALSSPSNSSVQDLRIRRSSFHVSRAGEPSSARASASSSRSHVPPSRTPSLTMGAYVPPLAIGLLGSENTARSLVSLILAISADCPLIYYDSLRALLDADAAAREGRSAGEPPEIIAVCTGPSLPLHGLDELPLLTIKGVPRRWLFIGEVDDDLEEEIMESDLCEMVRGKTGAPCARPRTCRTQSL